LGKSRGCCLASPTPKDGILRQTMIERVRVVIAPLVTNTTQLRRETQSSPSPKSHFTQAVKIWCRLGDSNTRPTHYECVALPAELRRLTWLFPAELSRLSPYCLRSRKFSQLFRHGRAVGALKRRHWPALSSLASALSQMTALWPRVRPAMRVWNCQKCVRSVRPQCPTVFRMLPSNM
jgi:hypothetical protein